MNALIRPHQWRLKTLVLLGAMVVALGCRDQAQVTANDPNKGATGAALAAETRSEPTNTPAELSDADPLRNVRRIEPAIGNKLSPPVAEIVKLAQGGLSEDVLLAYVEKAPPTAALSVEEILYLYDLGLPVPVISALIRHGNAAQGTAKTAPELAEAPPAVAAPVTPQYAQPSPPQYSPPQYAAPSPIHDQPQQEPLPPENTTPTPVYAGPVVQDYSQFYDQLSPYGTWVDLPEYGWSWQPYAASLTVGWRPYSQRGRWLYSDYGWYWQSDYSWGWAPFHYGRWAHYPRRGWYWVPDRTWGPSWVCFRQSDAYYGWAPLPPRAHWSAGVGFGFRGGVGVGFDFGLTDDWFTFVPHNRFCDPLVANHFVSSTRVKNIYKQTKVVNNYHVGPNNTVINKGIPEETVARVSRTEVPKVKVRETSVAPGKFVRGDRVERDGNSLVVYKPRLQTSAPSAPGRGDRGENADFPSHRALATRSGRDLPSKPESSAPAVAGVPSGGGVIKPLERRGTVASTERNDRSGDNPARATVPVFPQLQNDRRGLSRSGVTPNLDIANAAPAPPANVHRPSLEGRSDTPNKSVYSNNRPNDGMKQVEPPRGQARVYTVPSPGLNQQSRANVPTRPQFQTPVAPQISRPDNNRPAQREERFDRPNQNFSRQRNNDPSAGSVARPSAPPSLNRPSYSQPSQGQPFRPPTSVAPQPRYQAPSMDAPRQRTPSSQAPSIQQKAPEPSRNHNNPTVQSPPARSTPPPSPGSRGDGDRRRDR